MVTGLTREATRESTTRALAIRGRGRASHRRTDSGSQTQRGPIFLSKYGVFAPPPSTGIELSYLLAGRVRGTVMTLLMSISLLSIGASLGFVIAGILNKSDVET
jgi:hypothetical protein